MLTAISLGNWACDPVHAKAMHRFGVHWTKSQVSIDILVSSRYLDTNRARHASQRCAPGGTFFAQNPGKAVQP